MARVDIDEGRVQSNNMIRSIARSTLILMDVIRHDTTSSDSDSCDLPGNGGMFSSTPSNARSSWTSNSL